MARRKKRISISLFPFLSVLACVIGTLTLMISALALGQMDTSSVADAERFQNIKRQLAEQQRLIDAAKKRMAAVENSEDDGLRRLAEMQQELNRLYQRRDQLQQESYRATQQQAPALDRAAYEKEIEELKRQLAELQRKIEQQNQALAQRKKAPEPAEVQIRPGGSGVGLKPSFVECRPEGIVLHTGPAPHTVPAASLGRDPRFIGLLKEVAEDPARTVVFLVREDGVATYKAAKPIATNNYARNGKLPILGQGKLDLSLFNQ